MSRVLLQTPEGEVVGSISGIGVDSLQALSLALRMSGYKLLDYTNSRKSLCFCDYPESKKSVLKLISTDSSSLVEMDKSTDASIDSPVVAQLAGLSIHGPQAEPTNLSISIKYPTETEDMWYCTIEFLGLNQCKSYASRDSTRVLAKAFRGLHRQLLEWQHKGFKILDEEGQNLLEEQSLRCYFHSAEDVSSSPKNAQEPQEP